MLPQTAQIYTLQQSKQSMVIIGENLLPGRQYVAEVQVAVHPSAFTSMWSEWSSVEWTSDSPQSEQYYFLLLTLPVVMVVLLVYSGKL